MRFSIPRAAYFLFLLPLFKYFFPKTLEVTRKSRIFAEERTGILCRQSIVLHGTCHCAAGRSWNLGLSLGSSLYGMFHGLCIAKSDIKEVSYRHGAYRFADTPASVRQNAYCVPPTAIVRQAYGGRVYGYI